MSAALDVLSTQDSLVRRVLNRSFGQAYGELAVGSLSLTSLVEQYGTPLFVYDLDVASRQWDRLRQSLPEPVDLYYSIKANPHPAILSRFLRAGAGFEVASAAELRRAMQVGGDPQKIIFAGPGKTDAELELAIASGIAAIHAESLGELRRIESIAGRLRATAPVAIRVNANAVAQGGAMRMGGKASPFGIDEERLDSAIDFLLRCDRLQWQGLHFYNGTQILDAAVLQRQYLHAIDVARNVAERTCRPMPTLDFGGGLGVPYLDTDSDLDLAAFQSHVDELIEKATRHPGLAQTRFILEPGRFLVAEAGIYVTRVLDVKHSRGKQFVVVDGGMHHHLAASGNLGQTIKRNYPTAVLNKLNEPATGTADIVGCLCTPLDTLARNLPLPEIVPGDLIGIFQSGAYALTASPQGFLSHPLPAELFVSQGAAWIGNE